MDTRALEIEIESIRAPEILVYTAISVGSSPDGLCCLQPSRPQSNQFLDFCYRFARV